MGSTFVNPTSRAYLCVNRIGGAALVTIGNCALPTALTYVGAASGDFGSTVSLAANLTTRPASGGAP